MASFITCRKSDKNVVTKKLGNIPAIAKASYIDPRVIVAYENEVELPKLRKSMTSMRPKKCMGVDEQCALRSLKT